MEEYLVNSKGDIITITDPALFPLVDLINTLETDPQEMPFWGNLGIPAHDTIISKKAPDYYINNLVQYFSQFFDTLKIKKINFNKYNIYVKLKNGVAFSGDIDKILDTF